MKQQDIRDLHLHVVQNETGKHLRIAIEGELKAVIARMIARPLKMTGSSLLQNDDGTPVSPFELRSRFDRVRRAVASPFSFVTSGRSWPATPAAGHIRKNCSGHQSGNMTEHYVRSRIGERAKPVRVARFGSAHSIPVTTLVADV